MIFQGCKQQIWKPAAPDAHNSTLSSSGMVMAVFSGSSLTGDLTLLRDCVAWSHRLSTIPEIALSASGAVHFLRLAVW
jgi:hypothetical protein